MKTEDISGFSPPASPRCNHLKNLPMPPRGTEILINSGPFAGFNAIVESVGGNRVFVRISLKNRRSVLFDIEPTAFDVELKRRGQCTARTLRRLSKASTVTPFTQATAG